MSNQIRSIVAALALASAFGCRAHAATAQSAPQAPGNYASINGLRMYYEVHGAGRPLVLIHGGGSTAQTSFGALIPSLAKHHRIIAPEEQGHGHTADNDRPFSFEQMADDTAALLDQLGIREADVFGFSNGGRVALVMAIRHPKLVRRLVIGSSYAKRDAFPPQFWEGMEHASPDSMPATLRDAYVAASPQPDLARFVAKTKAMMLSTRDLTPEELRAIQAPTLLMIGDADVVRPEHALELFRMLPHAQLAVFPGAAHGAYMGAAESAKKGSQQPEMAATMIEEFLSAP
jgi:pimeloyl-ACP methyl ester carboxylesterase